MMVEYDENGKPLIKGTPNIEEEIIFLPTNDKEKIERILISPKGCNLIYLLELPYEMEGEAEFIFSGTNDSGGGKHEAKGSYEGNINRHTQSNLYNIIPGLREFPHLQIILPHYDITEDDIENEMPIYGTLNAECFDENLMKREDLGENDKFSRIDLQIKNCIEYAKEFVEHHRDNVRIQEKVNVWGYSQGGVFAERFAFLHPELVHRCITGGNVGISPILDDTLDYPIGTRDYEKLFGKPFDSKAHKEIKFLQFCAEYEAHPALKSYDVEGNKVENICVDGDEPPRYADNGLIYTMDKSDRRIPLPPNNDGSYLRHEMSIEVGENLRKPVDQRRTWSFFR